jgi:ABC-type transport system substrate-binding protein
VTARDVYDSITSIINLQKAQIGWALGEISGFDGAVKSGNVANLGIKITNTFNLRFTFKQANPLFLNFLATPSVYIFSNSKDELAPFGSGPFVVATHDESSWILKSTANRSDKIQFITTSSSKPYDLSSFLPESAKIQPLTEFDRYSFPLLQTVIMVFNHKSGRLSDNKLRCHLASLFQGVLSDKSFYQWQPINLGLPFSWDIAKVQNGYQLKNISELSPLSVNIIYANSAAHFSDTINSKAADEFQKMGFTIKFREESIQSLIKRVRIDDFQVALFGYVPDYPHLDALLTPFVGTGQQYNFSKYSNHRYQL